MSGVAGIFALDESTPTALELEATITRLEHRGPDGTHIFIDRQVALGHTLLATTPEALIETLPFTHGPTGCTITADARIDNREQLIAALDLVGETRTIGDGELILCAYLKWDEHCPQQLLGDFAFAIWDPRSTSVFCARDQIGMRQLVYHFDAGRRLIFATEPGAILALPDINASLNHDRIGDYLSNMEGADHISTFFRDIQRLPPAHSLKVDRHGLVVRRYWELAPEPILQLPSDDAYAEAFLALFNEAVSCRVRNAGSIGAMVSGGIDSNAVAATAANLLAGEARGPLPTFSAIGPEVSECVETRAILTAVRSPKFAPTTVSYGALGELRDALERETAESVEPFDGDMAVIRAVYLTARRAGINTVLDGVSSDVLLSSPFHMAFLFREAKFFQLLREAKGEAQFWGPKFRAWRALLAGAWQAYVPTPIRAIRFWRGRRKADRHFQVQASTVVPFLDLPRLLARRKRVQRRDFDQDRVDALTRKRILTHPNVAVARERYDRVAAASGIEPRDPFLDLRLIRFCLSLPRDQLQRNGWPKWILRQAVARHVPAEIVWRRGKKHLGPRFTRAITGEPISVGSTEAHALDPIATREGNKTIYLTNWLAYVSYMWEPTVSDKKEGVA